MLTEIKNIIATAEILEQFNSNFEYLEDYIEALQVDEFFILNNEEDLTKKFVFDLSNITTDNIRTLFPADYNQDLANPLFKTFILDTTYVETGEESTATSWWDSDNQTIVFKHLDGGVIQINQEEFDIYTNLSGGTLVNGDVVSIVGASGNRTAVTLTDVSSTNLSNACIGMVTVPTIGNNTPGRITKWGKIRGLDTSSFEEGDLVYVDPLNPGKLTNVCPSAEYYCICVGVVDVKHAVEGVIDLNIRIFNKLEDLSGVDGTPLTTTGQIPVWNNENGYFDFNYNIKHLTTLKVGGETNYTEIESGGTIKFIGNSTVFTDVVRDVTNLKVQGSGLSINVTENSLDYLTSSNLLDYAYTNYQIPHEWKIGSTIYPHIHWQQAEDNLPNWLIQYRWQTNGAAKTTSWTNYSLDTNVYTYTSGILNQISHNSGLVPPAGASLSDIIQIRLFRDTDNGSGEFSGLDPYTATASVTNVDIHFELDTLGSRTEYTK